MDEICRRKEVFVREGRKLVVSTLARAQQQGLQEDNVNEVSFDDRGMSLEQQEVRR
jgi:hypothetical protein